jgi:hypothetical protein
MNKETKNYYDLKIEFEKTHFKVITPFTYVQIINERVVERSKTELLQVYENLWCRKKKIKKSTENLETEEIKKVNFAKEWIMDPDIRTYKCIVFEPCKKIKADEYNLWNGWKGSKLPPSSAKFENSYMYNHIKYIFGELFEYSLDMFAHMIQTGDKVDVCHILCSVPGTGKDLLLNHFGLNILGSDYFLNEDHLEMLIGGNFNEDISRKVLIVLNESKRAKTDDIIEAIKNAITRQSNSIRIKNEKTRHEKNNITWMSLTNNFDSFKIEHGDRRFLANKIPSTHKNDTTYFKNIVDEIERKEYDRAFYDFLNNRNIKIKHFQNERPSTSYYRDLQERNIPISAQFLVNIMQEELDELEVLKIPAKSFYDRYILFLKQNGYEFKHTMTKFGLEMKQYTVVEKFNTKKCIMYTINIKDLEAYLSKEKYYNASDNEIVDVTPNAKMYMNPEDKTSYVRAEDYNELKVKLVKLEEEMSILKSNGSTLKRVTYEYDNDDISSDQIEIPSFFKHNLFHNHVDKVVVDCKKSKKSKIVTAVKANSNNNETHKKRTKKTEELTVTEDDSNNLKKLFLQNT